MHLVAIAARALKMRLDFSRCSGAAQRGEREVFLIKFLLVLRIPIRA